MRPPPPPSVCGPPGAMSAAGGLRRQVPADAAASQLELQFTGFKCCRETFEEQTPE